MLKADMDLIVSRSLRPLFDRASHLLKEVEYKEGWNFILAAEKTAIYIQVEVWRADAHTGEMDFGYGGKAYLRPEMTDGEIVRRAFNLCMAFEEHEARELFRFNGRSVFGPHIDLCALWNAAVHTDPVLP